MYCTKCGKEIKDNSKFCPYCGEPITQTAAGSNASGTKLSDDNISQNNTSNYDDQYNEASDDEMPTMYWYKYLVYVGMFLYAILLAFIVIEYFTGALAPNSYSGELLYNRYPILNTFDAIFAAFSFVMAIRGILIRQDLKHYKKNAGKSFIRDISIFMAGYLVYVFAGNIAVPGINIPEDIIEDVVFIAIDVVFVYCNVRYFRNREGLFQN